MNLPASSRPRGGPCATKRQWRRRTSAPTPCSLQLPPVRPDPNLGEIPPTRRSPLRSSPGEEARDLATRSGSGLGDLGCALQIPLGPRAFGPPTEFASSSVAAIFFWCVVHCSSPTPLMPDVASSRSIAGEILRIRVGTNLKIVEFIIYCFKILEKNKNM
jgi:hypothetical protein